MQLQSFCPPSRVADRWQRKATALRGSRNSLESGEERCFFFLPLPAQLVEGSGQRAGACRMMADFEGPASVAESRVDFKSTPRARGALCVALLVRMQPCLGPWGRMWDGGGDFTKCLLRLPVNRRGQPWFLAGLAWPAMLFEHFQDLEIP